MMRKWWNAWKETNPGVHPSGWVVVALTAGAGGFAAAHFYSLISDSLVHNTEPQPTDRVGPSLPSQLLWHRRLQSVTEALSGTEDVYFLRHNGNAETNWGCWRQLKRSCKKMSFRAKCDRNSGSLPEKDGNCLLFTPALSGRSVSGHFMLIVMKLKQTKKWKQNSFDSLNGGLCDISLSTCFVCSFFL